MIRHYMNRKGLQSYGRRRQYSDTRCRICTVDCGIRHWSLYVRYLFHTNMPSLWPVSRSHPFESLCSCSDPSLGLCSRWSGVEDLSKANTASVQSASAGRPRSAREWNNGPECFRHRSQLRNPTMKTSASTPSGFRDAIRGKLGSNCLKTSSRTS